MEAQRNIPRTNLRSVKLVIRNNRTLRQYFEVKVMESTMVKDKLTTRVCDSIHTNSVSELVMFMGRHGVHQNEISVAGQVMAQMDHNGADFGWFGGLVTTFLDEVTQ